MQESKISIKAATIKLLILVVYASLSGVVITTYRMSTNNQKAETYNVNSNITSNLETIDYSDLKEYITKREALVVDARAPSFYEAGHIPSAINLPLSNYEKYLEGYQNLFREKSLIIIYCKNFSCPDSEDLANILVKKGLKKIKIYKGGYEEWELIEKY